MFEYTGVDGIMIGRAAIGNPWIFSKIINFLQTNKKQKDLTNSEKLEVIKKHIEFQLKEKEEKIAIQTLRKHMAYYTKNLKEATTARKKINTIETKEQLIKILEEYFKE